MFPQDVKYSFEIRKNDIMAMYLEFINSVDGSLRLSLRVSWLRLVCTNGLIVREVLWDFSRPHLGAEILGEFEEYLPVALQSAVGYKTLFERWLRTRITKQAYEDWIEGTVRNIWGLKAAVRAYHIGCRGVDVKIEKMLRGVSVTAIPVKDLRPVIGALAGSLNIFAISQVLTWLAGDRGEFQEQLNWKSQVYEMLAKLVPDAAQQELFQAPAVSKV